MKKFKIIYSKSKKGFSSEEVLSDSKSKVTKYVEENIKDYPNFLDIQEISLYNIVVGTDEVIEFTELKTHGNNKKDLLDNCLISFYNKDGREIDKPQRLDNITKGFYNSFKEIILQEYEEQMKKLLDITDK